MAKSKKSIWAIIGGIVGLLAVVGATFGIVTAVKQSKCEHVWNDGEVKVEATCAKEGKIMFRCDDCGKIEIEKIEKLPHVWMDEELKLPTCAENGHTEYTYCENCDAYKNGVEPQVLLALGHTEEVIEGRAATCTESGITIGKYCTTCNEMTVEQRVIAAKGHNVVQVAAKAATCTEPGHTAGQKCSNCDLVYSGIEEVPAKGHKDDNSDGYCDTCRTSLSPTASMKEVELNTTGDSVLGRYVRFYKPNSKYGTSSNTNYNEDDGYIHLIMVNVGGTGSLTTFYLFNDGLYCEDSKNTKIEGFVVNETSTYVDVYFSEEVEYERKSTANGSFCGSVAFTEETAFDLNSKEGIYFLEKK